MSLLSILPIFPLYYNGKTRFSPIHCSDLTDILFCVISKNISTKIIECVGPEIMSFKEILNQLLISIKKKKIINAIPVIYGKFICKFF